MKTFLNVPIICDLKVYGGSSLVVCSWISIFRCNFPQSLEILGILPWTVSCQQFPAVPFRSVKHGALGIVPQQFPATPLRLLLFHTLGQTSKTQWFVLNETCAVTHLLAS